MKELFPYPTLFGDVNLTVTEIYIDDKTVRERVDVDGCTVDLSRIEKSDWETARISLVVHAPPSEIANAIEARCIAVANCGPSNYRISVPLSEEPDTLGQWRGDLEIDRLYWYSQAQLRAHVVSTVAGTSNRIIGSSEPWTLLYDDLPNRPIRGAIKISWVDFDNPGDGKLFLRNHQDQYVFLSIDPDEPQLFLNRSFDGLEQLLADRRRPGRDRALHDQTRASIADKTWSALFNAAIDAVEANADSGELEWPPIDWQRNILESLLVRMYPGKVAEEALHDAWTTRNASDSPGTLQQLLAPATAKQVGAPRLLRDGIRLIAAELETNGEEV